MENNIHLLLAEDEQTLADIIGDTLNSNGFRVQIAYDGEQALKLLNENKFDIIVSDIMMPRLDGFSLVEHLRKKGNTTPVLFLSARSSADDVVQGFETGANDYLRKPFAMNELIIRIKSLLGRVQTVAEPENRRYQIGKFTFDPLKGELRSGTKPLEILLLSGREAEVLHYLCRHLNRVVENKTILLDLWGDDNFFNMRSLHVFITRLRHKLSEDPSVNIINIRGVGYKLVSDISH